ncbi:hypothetical protein OOK39_45485 [Streptomyces sp. NBC_00264]|uniref:hypothetical protein n=1 Tax=unclassified Streptomyces TaxID=2593676 RepID=UPI00224CF4ED|nr:MULTISPECIES: hypothetical protein [unclassified Streptomyces]MCX5166291.1 hypothetical protein [Streptomyces sp. NBC_00305]MCX5224808.1 hypothetical protein [Streptomyces sp. NBC_00264]
MRPSANAVGRAIRRQDRGERRAEGEPYTRVETVLVVEVLAGSGWHGTLTVVRMR